MYPVGTKIYYTGDVANQPLWGEVESHGGGNGNPPYMNLRMENGEKFMGIFPSHFSPSPGRRFMLKEEYDADRAARIKEFRAAHKRYKELSG
jgi:hypothetical protein